MVNSIHTSNLITQLQDNYFNKIIHPELLEIIFSFLPPLELTNSSLVCKKWNQIHNTPFLWDQVIRKDLELHGFCVIKPSGVHYPKHLIHELHQPSKIFPDELEGKSTITCFEDNGTGFRITVKNVPNSRGKSIPALKKLLADKDPSYRMGTKEEITKALNKISQATKTYLLGTNPMSYTICSDGEKYAYIGSNSPKGLATNEVRSETKGLPSMGITGFKSL